MYHFVKIDNIWYLKPETKQDIIDHFNTIVKKCFEEGLKDRVSSTYLCKNYFGQGKDYIYIEHPTTDWAKAVEQYMHIWGLTWVETAHKLETVTYNDRLNTFDKLSAQGKTFYLRNGLGIFCCPNATYDDEVWSDKMEYPIKDVYTIDDVRYIQWKDGSHWYAKVGNIDIVDPDGRQKWDTKEEAMKWAQIWINLETMKFKDKSEI